MPPTSEPARKTERDTTGIQDRRHPADIHEITKEVTIARPGKTTMAKRDREKSIQAKRKEKEEKRAIRKNEKDVRGTTPEGEDPDLAGLRWGPQAPLF
ncbi:hypothetical protein ACO9S2_00365 [Nitrospira sp. NS4]|uniref:hypothetical protein n=1 Tax=Nitrospira sp. NS4 TaxID=3414498 RepID=UPI003C2EC2E6